MQENMPNILEPVSMGEILLWQIWSIARDSVQLPPSQCGTFPWTTAYDCFIIISLHKTKISNILQHI